MAETSHRPPRAGIRGRPLVGRPPAPLGISQQSSDLSRCLMQRYLRQNDYDFALLRLVKPRSPLRNRGRPVPQGDFAESALKDVEAIGDPVSAL